MNSASFEQTYRLLQTMNIIAMVWWTAVLIAGIVVYRILFGE